MTDVVFLQLYLALFRIVLFVLGIYQLGANFTVSHRPRDTLSQKTRISLVFARSGRARGLGSSFCLEPQEPTNSASRAGSSQHKLGLKPDSSQAGAFVIFDPLKSFISNLATGRAERNGTERGQVKRGAGESGSRQVSQYES